MRDYNHNAGFRDHYIFMIDRHKAAVANIATLTNAQDE